MGDLIRVVKSGDYSLISNYHLKDQRLSWGAKGLLTTMLAFSGEYAIDELGKLSYNGIYCTDVVYGTDLFMELERYGYLTWKRIGVEERYPVLEYMIYEKPIGRRSSLDHVAEIMDPENIPGRLEDIDEEEKQRLRERLAIDKWEEQYSTRFVGLVFNELCKRDADLRKRMTSKTFEKVCDTVLKQCEEFSEQNKRFFENVLFWWRLEINAAFDNIEKGFRKKIPQTNRGVVERESRKE